jgi:secondary thiamine-phosphate synthase enzyme
MIHGETLTRRTRGFSDIHDLTADVRAVVARAGIEAGVVHVSAIGSTASITTIEFEPALVRDMEEALEKLWPRTMASHHSQTWGDDNGFSHLRASFMGPGITVPVHEGELVLGTWQQIVVIDHDNGPRERRVFVQVMGE